MTSNRLAIAFLLAALVLAGCTSNATVTTYLAVDDGRAVQPTTYLSHAIQIDLAARPAQSLYAAHGATHPAFYSAFDQLVQWSQDAHVAINATYAASFGDFFLSTIGGVPSDPASAYWSLLVNGTASEKGMGQVALHGGEHIQWQLVPLTTTSSSASTPLALQVPTKLTTHGETIRLNGTLAGMAKLTFLPAGLNVPAMQADGAWHATIPLPPGRTALRVVASNDLTTTAANVTLVRLVPVTVKVDYKMAPGHTPRDDQVWLDLGAYPSAPMYAGKDLSHPAFATAHDAMVEWSNQTGVKVTYEYSAGLGYSVSNIDGVGTPVSVPVQPWCYDFDGKSASKGISTQPIAAGSEIEWVLGCA